MGLGLILRMHQDSTEVLWLSVYSTAYLIEGKHTFACLFFDAVTIQ